MANVKIVSTADIKDRKPKIKKKAKMKWFTKFYS